MSVPPRLRNGCNIKGSATSAFSAVAALVSACGLQPATYADVQTYEIVQIDPIKTDTSTDAKADSSGTTDAANDATATSDAATPTDAGADTVIAPGCTKAADCAALSLNPCAIGTCDGASHQCTIIAVADGQTCQVTGACGGAGTCQGSACVLSKPCGAVACSAKPLACGQKVDLNPGALAKVLTTYGCADEIWTGGEQVFTLSHPSAQVALLQLSGGGNWRILDLAIGKPDTCDASTCASAGSPLQLGLLAGKTRLVVVDSAAGATPTTLTVVCAGTQCGDGACTSSETCWNCTADCGKCTTCGDGKCATAVLENCTTCTKDCGACKAGCASKAEPGCPENTCEACVCGFDKFCCTTSWDGSCQSKCETCNKNVCGDGTCTDGEDKGGCLADCPPLSDCGDGMCHSDETCGECSQDCGNCKAGVAVCGDGLCTTGEHCGTCPADCGGCGGVACVCKIDPYCCSTAFDSKCQATCATCAKGLCPKTACGDGACNGGEKTATCPSDCPSVSAPVCGDGVCAVGEATSCPSDCGLGCKGNCGASGKTATGGTCWCDETCAANGDCCADKKTHCP
ncbi:MAG: hypothetical protein EXR77_09775 [Myxococcales bacterium]|nr:hypothetical protein [Myxococcales bacterium]